MSQFCLEIENLNIVEESDDYAFISAFLELCGYDSENASVYEDVVIITGSPDKSADNCRSDAEKVPERKPASTFQIVCNGTLAVLIVDIDGIYILLTEKFSQNAPVLLGNLFAAFQDLARFLVPYI